MELFTSKKWWGYTGRFLLIHIVTYSIVAVVFSFVKDALPTSSRIALDFYKLYEPFNFLVLITQIIRGIIISFALYPFYNSIIKSSRGVLVLFGLLWGMVVVGSLEPLPGSIEGMIYTTTTLLEHLMVMIAGAIQALLFSWLFLCWEYKVGKIDLIRDRHEKRYKDYLTRFILLHVITYTLIGVLFYQLQDYKVAFEIQEYFKLFRPTDHPLVKYSVFIQILRGGILAVFLYLFITFLWGGSKAGYYCLV